MECSEARTFLLDRRRGTLSAPVRAPVEVHLAECESCRLDDAADSVLSTLLERSLPRRRAPESLRRAVAARWDRPSLPPRLSRAGRVARAAGAMALGAAVAVLVVFGWHARSSDETMVAEAVGDHLRVLYRDRPVEVESGGIHQVKPWFEGRLDFAPVVSFGGDDDFPLLGGSVGYFVDRKAATFVFKRRLHLITLFVFRAQGLPWPAITPELVGHAHGTLRTSNGFHVLFWRDGDLGYALVSDVDERDLKTLASKIPNGG
jgi:anti-sigma factor RsiW